MWQGSGTNRIEYILVNCQNICITKHFGGVGILDLDQMNISLLKWWWKLKNNAYEGLWKTIIIAKQNLHCVLSSYYKAILKLDYLDELSVTYCAGQHSSFQF